MTVVPHQIRSLATAGILALLPTVAGAQAPTLIIEDGRVIVGDGTVFDRASGEMGSGTGKAIKRT